jgi:hypothetical protein
MVPCTMSFHDTSTNKVASSAKPARYPYSCALGGSGRPRIASSA